MACSHCCNCCPRKCFPPHRFRRRGGTSLVSGSRIIGGDEVPKSYWQHCAKCQARERAEGLKDEGQLQGYFIRRMDKFITAQGRSLVGWTEIRQGGLARSAVVMDYKGGAVESATEGHDVVMSPSPLCYFDHYQSLDYSAEPAAIGCYFTGPPPPGCSPNRASATWFLNTRVAAGLMLAGWPCWRTAGRLPATPMPA